MTKQLKKMIMNRSRCKNAYYKNKTVDKWEKYRKLRNGCVKLTKKVKREYFERLKINSVNDNKIFWKTVNPFFTDKNKKNGKIVLVEDNRMITDNVKNAEIFNEYFVNITQNLDIPDITNEVLPIEVEYIDPIDKIIYNYSKHPSPSIIKIKQIIKSNDNFSFHEVNQNEIEQEIVQLNVKKSAGPEIIKDSIIVVKAPLTTLFNTSVKESLFPSGLKYGNVSPLYKKNENTKKENYRPISILPSISKILKGLCFNRLLHMYQTSYPLIYVDSGKDITRNMLF